MALVMPLEWLLSWTLCIKVFLMFILKIYGETPKWFWQQNLRHQINFQCIQLETDIGLLQVDPFNHDIERTCHSLRNYLNFSSDSFLKARKRVARSNIDLILCDISPMGIVIGEQLKIPSMLIENFTWDWIYEDFLKEIQYSDATA